MALDSPIFCYSALSWPVLWDVASLKEGTSLTTIYVSNQLYECCCEGDELVDTAVMACWHVIDLDGHVV